MKSYPLDVQRLHENDGFGDGSWLGWWSKGHHDTAAFLNAVLDLEGDDDRDRIGPVRQETWRAIPDSPAGDGSMFFHPAQPGRRGAFPVTVADRAAKERP